MMYEPCKKKKPVSANKLKLLISMSGYTRSHWDIRRTRWMRKPHHQIASENLRFRAYSRCIGEPAVLTMQRKYLLTLVLSYKPTGVCKPSYSPSSTIASDPSSTTSPSTSTAS